MADKSSSSSSPKATSSSRVAYGTTTTCCCPVDYKLTDEEKLRIHRRIMASFSTHISRGFGFKGAHRARLPTKTTAYSNTPHLRRLEPPQQTFGPEILRRYLEEPLCITEGRAHILK